MSKAIRNIQPLKLSSPQDKISIIIPAAGEGTRMKSYGAKSLIKLTPNLNILQHQLSVIQKTIPEYELIFITGHEANKVFGYLPLGVIGIENEKYKETNVVRSIAMGLRAISTNRVLIIYGDLVFNSTTLRVPLEHYSLLWAAPNIMTEDEVGCVVADGFVEHMIYELPNKWAQIMYLTGNELQTFKEMVFNPANSNKFGFEIINETINKHGKFKAVSPKNMKINDVDTSKDIAIVRDII
jgi:choline kinase